jgi:hypothetical protein
MKNTIQAICLAALFICTVSMLNACRNADNDGTIAPGMQETSLYLTDDPGFYDKVLVDIQSVDILVDTCVITHAGIQVWEALGITPGIYDLLAFRNGLETLLGEATIPAGAIKKISIHLGTANSLVKNNASYPLHVPDSSMIMVDVSGHTWYEDEPRSFKLWLDIDIARSIVLGHDNEFYFNPVTKVFTLSSTGSVFGQVFPANAYPVLSVSNGTDTAFAIPDGEGYFEVRGLNPGTYNIFINASGTYHDTTITNINIVAGTQNFAGDIVLHSY